jgi:two-component system phosphate regulon sensor histidine kinase PhoR
VIRWITLSALVAAALAVTSAALILAVPAPLTGPARATARLLQVAGTITAAGSALGALIAWRAVAVHRRRLDEFSRSVRASDPGGFAVEAAGLDWRELAELASAVESLAGRLRHTIEAEAAERVRLESVLAAMTDGILVVDANGTVQLANDAAVTVLGASVPDARGKRLLELTRANDVHELAHNAAADGKAGLRQFELMPDRRHLHVVAVPIIPENDRSQGRALLVIKDVTEMHRVDVTRREFISNASHELRTPVAAIKASAETLQVGADDPAAVAQFTQRIVQDADRMDRMLGELLELSRLESGHTPMHMGPVDLSTFSEDAVSRFRPIADARQVMVRCEVDGGLPLLTADSEKLHQLVGNLISNGIKATPPGGTVMMRVERASGGIDVRVTDTGRGIEPQHIPHIFERFYKVSRTPGDDGAGLGLAIAKHIAQAHGGHITVKSRPGEGSTFTVWLPVPVGFDEVPARLNGDTGD